MNGMDADKMTFWYGRGAKPTWRCEPPLKALCSAFDDEWPECTPAPGNRASWYAGLRKIWREFGEDGGVRFILWAKQQIKERDRERQRRNQRPLDITDAHSIYFLVKDFKKLITGRADRCPNCGRSDTSCYCEWGSQRRREKYGE
jgi:hypothetical protein